MARYFSRKLVLVAVLAELLAFTLVTRTHIFAALAQGPDPEPKVHFMGMVSALPNASVHVRRPNVQPSGAALNTPKPQDNEVDVQEFPEAPQPVI